MMAILLKNGSLFFHVPKTGGNWVTMALERLGLSERRVDDKHADLDHFYAQRLLEGNRFKFCFVRHPLAWYVSWFKYATWKDHPVFSPPHPNAPLNGLAKGDFSGFIRRVIEERPGYLSAMYQGFTRGMDFVGRQERLEEHFIFALSVAGLEVDEKLVKSFGKFGTYPELPIKWDEGLKRRLLKKEQGAMVFYEGWLEYVGRWIN